MVKATSGQEIVDHQNLAQLAVAANYSAATLAEQRGVTLRTLQLHFRSDYGVSSQSCFEKLRDLEAWKLLQQGLPQKEIVMQLGYKHAPHLSRRMKKFRQGSEQAGNGKTSQKNHFR